MLKLDNGKGKDSILIFVLSGFLSLQLQQRTQAFCHRWRLAASLRRRVSGGALSLKMRTWISLGPFLKVPVVLFLYLRANVMELNTMWFHFMETFRSLKTKKLRSEVSWGGWAGAPDSRLSHRWCLGINSSEDSWPVMIFFSQLGSPDPWPCCTYLGEAQKVTAWHLCACDIIRLLIWQYTNYESWQSDTGKHFALPV